MQAKNPDSKCSIKSNNGTGMFLFIYLEHSAKWYRLHIHVGWRLCYVYWHTIFRTQYTAWLQPCRSFSKIIDYLTTLVSIGRHLSSRQYSNTFEIIGMTAMSWKSSHDKALEKVKGKGRYRLALHGNPISELRDVTCHMGSHSVTCHPTQVNVPRLTPAIEAGTRFTYPGGMEGWVDLVDLIAPRPGIEPAMIFRSRVRRRTAAPPRQP